MAQTNRKKPKNTAQLKRVMKLKRARGITLKEAWAIEKSGGRATRKARVRYSIKRRSGAVMARKYALARRTRRSVRRVSSSRGGRYLGRRRQSKNKIPMGLTIGLLSGAGAAAGFLAQGQIKNAFDSIKANYLGLDTANNFHMEYLKRGLLPLGLGGAISMVAAKTGVNKRLKLPFVKV